MLAKDAFATFNCPTMVNLSLDSPYNVEDFPPTILGLTSVFRLTFLAPDQNLSLTPARCGSKLAVQLLL
jgi:hypothetical protein